MNIGAEGYVRKNFTLAPEVWTSIYTEGYVRKHSTNIWSMNECCRRGLRA